MKIEGAESLEIGDIFAVRNVSDTLFSKKIEIEKLRSKEEVDIMLQYANDNREDSFWKGVYYALFWVMGLVDTVKEFERLVGKYRR